MGAIAVPAGDVFGVAVTVGQGKPIRAADVRGVGLRQFGELLGDVLYSQDNLNALVGALQEAILADITDFALRGLAGAALIGSMDSPIAGTDGNREFLMGLRKGLPSAVKTAIQPLV